jgi:hypothetical protein
MTSASTTTTATSALSRETHTTETPKTTDTHAQQRLKRLLLRFGETLSRLMSTGVGQWWLVWVSGAQQWVRGSNEATNLRPVWPYLTPSRFARYLKWRNLHLDPV